MKSLLDNIPNDWKTDSVKSISKTYSGGTPLRSNEHFYSGKINWVKSSELKNKYLYETEEHISDEGLNNSSARFVDADTIIFAMYGATAGDLCILKTKSTTNQAVLSIPLNDASLNIEYLYYYLKYKTQKLKFITQGGGQPNLSKGIIDNVPISHPPLPEQRAIASVLSKVDDAISATKETIAKAERLKKALMQNLLTGRLKPDGTRRTENEFYIDEKFGKVPKGWEVKKVKEIVRINLEYGANASAIPYDTGLPRFIRITDIDDNGCLINDDCVSILNEKASGYLLEDNDFLFARTGDTVGKSLLYKTKMGVSAYAGYLIRLQFDYTLIVPEYFDLIAKSDFFESFKNAMKRVGAKPNINAREYSSFKFILPNSLDEQKTILNKFEPIFISINHKELKIQKLERLKKALMQNLLTGKKRLQADYIQEFANG